MIGTQELIAILIVIAVVSFGLWRRLRRKSGSACANCDHVPPEPDERPVRLFRKQP